MTHGRVRSLVLCCALAAASGCAFAPPKEADEVFRRGLEQAEAGAVDRAMATLEEGVNTYPTHARMRFELARLQYESGETHHVLERRSIRDGAVESDRGDHERARAHQQQAAKHRGRAIPFYRTARTHLEQVVDQETDEARLGWAYFLLMRVSVFFEDWEAALEASEAAIERGRPTGAKLAQWREYQTGIRDKLGRAIDE